MTNKPLELQRNDFARAFRILEDFCDENVNEDDDLMEVYNTFSEWPQLFRFADDAEEWAKRAERLWQLLDDIDTASDMAKDDDVHYRRIVARTHKERFELADSDGHKLTWKTDADL